MDRSTGFPRDFRRSKYADETRRAAPVRITNISSFPINSHQPFTQFKATLRRGRHFTSGMMIPIKMYCPRPSSDLVIQLARRSSQLRGMQSCTGFAVTRDLLLTNWHCGPTLVPSGDGIKEIPDLFWPDDMCKRVLIDFSWDDDRISRDFKCDTVVERNQELDDPRLPIAPVSASSALKPVRLATARPSSDSQVSIIHHPLAEQKRISRECPLGPNLSRASWRGDIPATEFQHLCDTEGGSSGAPVFDETGAVVGLHHLGFDRDRDTCELLPNTPKVNKAVWIDAIVADLKKGGSVHAIPRPPRHCQ